jgi:hypothetical protein
LGLDDEDYNKLNLFLDYMHSFSIRKEEEGLINISVCSHAGAVQTCVSRLKLSLVVLNPDPAGNEEEMTKFSPVSVKSEPLYKLIGTSAARPPECARSLEFSRNPRFNELGNDRPPQRPWITLTCTF